MSFAQCPTCRAFDNLGYHRCPPAWHVMPDDYGDDETPNTEYAHDAYGAAEAHLERNFSSYDYPDAMTFKVRPASGGEWEMYTVEVEAQPVFTARKAVRS